MSLHDTYSIATMGYNSLNTYTVASLGILYFVQIEPIPDDGADNNYSLGLDQSDIYDPYQTPAKKDKYKITVTAIVDGKSYTESKIVERDVKVTSKDIKLSFDKKEKKVSINVK